MESMDDERIIELERLHSATVLARGVFHQFGNMLTLISGYASLARMSLAPGSEEEQQLERIENAVKQTSSLLDDTHRFIRGKPVPAGTVDCVKTAREASRLLEAVFPRLEVETRFPRGDASVTGSPRDLNDALIHLAINSYESMDRQGKVLIEVRTDDHAIALLVSDRGPGIPPELLDRVLEPGFSGRTDGELFTTGLGLSAARAITERMGGTMSLESRPGGGLTVSMSFPRAEDSA